MPARTTPPRNPPSRVTVRLVRGPADLRDATAMLREYREWLVTHREVTAFDDSILKVGADDFDREIDALPGAYRPPRGALFVVRDGSDAIGCGALRPQGRNVAEVKRLYLRSSYRGRGLGRRIARTVLRRARQLGYERVVLDTLPTMTAAIELYRSMGFRPIRAYWQHPVPGALFFGLSLRARPGRPRKASR